MGNLEKWSLGKAEIWKLLLTFRIIQKVKNEFNREKADKHSDNENEKTRKREKNKPQLVSFSFPIFVSLSTCHAVLALIKKTDFR